MIPALTKSPRAIDLTGNKILPGTGEPQAWPSGHSGTSEAGGGAPAATTPPRPHVFICWLCETHEHRPTLDLPEGWAEVGMGEAVCTDCRASVEQPL